MRQHDAFWVVWNVDGGSPTVKHDNITSATSEAQRLARTCPGESFVVLRSVVLFVVDHMQRVDYRDDEIPF